MRRLLALLLLAALSLPAHAQRKPDIYRHGDGQPPSGLDKRILDAYRGRFNIVDIRGEGYVPPQPLAGAVAGEAIAPTGETLTGHVIVAFIVREDGRAVQPVVIDTTDRRLNPYAVRSVTLWKFNAATWKGKSIPTIAAQEFNFK